MGEPFGVALANDATYGHDVTRHARTGGGTFSRVRASLLRAPRYPDPETDQGVHRFAYRLVSDATIADAVAAGYRLNLPLRNRNAAGPVAPLVSVEGDGVVVESVKLAEDRSGDLVVRLYEALGARTKARVTWDIKATGVSIVDLLERDIEARPDAAGGTTVELRPFQILTLRVRGEDAG